MRTFSVFMQLILIAVVAVIATDSNSKPSAKQKETLYPWQHFDPVVTTPPPFDQYYGPEEIHLAYQNIERLINVLKDTGATPTQQPHCSPPQIISGLRPYYEFIARIRVIVEKAIEQQKQEIPDGFFHVKSGFVSWPTPNFIHERTCEGVFLVTTVYTSAEIAEEEHVYKLWTPFGYVSLLDLGCSRKIHRVSQLVMDQLNTISTRVSMDVSKIEMTNLFHALDAKLHRVYRLQWPDEPTSPSPGRIRFQAPQDRMAYYADFGFAFQDLSKGKRTF